jgi:LPXTG-site transpeptidase (sortase) family protein
VPAAFALPTATATPSIPVAARGPGFARQDSAEGSVPVMVAIPRLHSSAKIVTLGRQDDAPDLPAPTDPDTIGWYDFSARLGVPGNAVLVGHVDWAGRLRAFGHLKDLRAGDEVDVVDTDQNKLAYTVEATESVDATTAPAEFLSQHGPDEELTLITCGGVFDRAAHQYLSRVIVRAVRITAASTGANDE